MIGLWYSWAQYYLTHWKDKTPSAPTAPTEIFGSIDAMTATLTFNEAHHELVKGMAVKGPGLDDAMTEVGVAAVGHRSRQIRRHDLEADLIVGRESGAIRLLQPEKLLEELARNYRPRG